MSIASPPRLITAEDFQQLEFDVPVELVRGEIFEKTRPGIRHGFVCAAISHRLREWALRTKQYLVVGNDAGVMTLRNPDSVRGPDVMVIRKDRLPGGTIPEGWLTIAPELVVEVMSPSDRWDDVLEKTAEFLSIGVKEVWVIDPAERCVHGFQSSASPRRLTETELLTNESVLPGFSQPVVAIFAE